MEDIYKQLEEVNEKNKERLATLRKKMFEELRAKCPEVTSIVVSYNGECDGYNVENVCFYAGDSPVSTDGTKSVEDIVVEFMWAAVTSRHPSFEVNAGGYGDLEINVAYEMVAVKHYKRVIEYYEDEVV